MEPGVDVGKHGKETFEDIMDASRDDGNDSNDNGPNETDILNAAKTSNDAMKRARTSNEMHKRADQIEEQTKILNELTNTKSGFMLPTDAFEEVEKLWTNHENNFPILVKVLLHEVASRFLSFRASPGFPLALATYCDSIEEVELSGGETVSVRSSVVQVNGFDPETSDPLMKALWGLWGRELLMTQVAAAVGMRTTTRETIEENVRKGRLMTPYANRYGKLLNIALLREHVTGHPDVVAIPERSNPRCRTAEDERQKIENALFKPHGTDEFNPTNESIDVGMCMSVNEDSRAFKMIMEHDGPWKNRGFKATLTTVDKVTVGEKKQHATEVKWYFPIPNAILEAMGKDIRGGQNTDEIFAQAMADDVEKNLTMGVETFHRFIDDISSIDLLSLSAMTNAHPDLKLTEEEKNQAKVDADRIFGNNGNGASNRQIDVVKRKIFIRKLLEKVNKRNRQRVAELFSFTEDAVALLQDLVIAVSLRKAIRSSINTFASDESLTNPCMLFVSTSPLHQDHKRKRGQAHWSRMG